MFVLKLDVVEDGDGRFYRVRCPQLFRYVRYGRGVDRLLRRCRAEILTMLAERIVQDRVPTSADGNAFADAVRNVFEVQSDVEGL